MHTVGILSLQGDFAAHGAALQRAGAAPVYVREPAQLNDIDGLILPGGESSTMLKLLRSENLFDPLADFARRKPIFGTCAGAILMARDVTHPAQDSLGLLDIAVQRNGYGRQLDSRVVNVDLSPEFTRRCGPGNLEAVFIRAPIIRRLGPDVAVLAEYAGAPVLVEAGRHLAATFHPELTGDTRVHNLFLEKL